jgi:uncharacterized protein
MRVAMATVELRIESSHSLKDKRQVVRSAVERMRRRFNVSVAEIGSLDDWQTAVLGIVCVSNDAGYAQGVLDKALDWLAEERLDAEITGVSVEVL